MGIKRARADVVVVVEQMRITFSLFFQLINECREFPSRTSGRVVRKESTMDCDGLKRKMIGIH